MNEIKILAFAAEYVAQYHEQVRSDGTDITGSMKAFISEVDRGGRCYQSNTFLLFFMFAHIFLKMSKEQFCRERLKKFLLSRLSYSLGLNLTMPERALYRVANILLKNISKRVVSSVNSSRKLNKLKNK